MEIAVPKSSLWRIPISTLLVRIKGGMVNSNFSINLSITVSQNALIKKFAFLSKGVFCKLKTIILADIYFTIIKFPFLETIFGISAAGVTVRELPREMHKSAFFAFLNPSAIVFSGKF